MSSKATYAAIGPLKKFGHDSPRSAFPFLQYGSGSFLEVYVTLWWFFLLLRLVCSLLCAWGPRSRHDDDDDDDNHKQAFPLVKCQPYHINWKAAFGVDLVPIRLCLALIWIYPREAFCANRLVVPGIIRFTQADMMMPFASTVLLIGVRRKLLYVYYSLY